MPLLDLYTRNAASIAEHTIAPWGADETTAYLNSKQLSASNASQFASLASGRPGFIAELVDIFNKAGKLDEALDGTTMTSLVPMEVDTAELSDDDDAEDDDVRGERGHVGARAAMSEV